MGDTVALDHRFLHCHELPQILSSLEKLTKGPNIKSFSYFHQALSEHG